MELHLTADWRVGSEIGRGGFGRVHELEAGPHLPAVAKFIPKQPGADRELLFVDLPPLVRNVVPVIDAGEHEGSWVIVMPRAELSLRDHLEGSGKVLDLDSGLQVLVDIAQTLADLDGKVVHRDLKPENVLRLDGAWCLADFGISRYAEASTAPDTHKFAMSTPYAAPERWRAERATAAADIYALGVIAHELFSGSRPFPGPTAEAFREQHLHHDPPSLTSVPAGLAALVDECLFKAPTARPAAQNLLARLTKQAVAPRSGALAALAAANHAEVQRRAEADRQASVAMTAAERRGERQRAARTTFARISAVLHEAIVGAAPSARSASTPGGGWAIQLGPAQLRLVGPTTGSQNWGRWDGPAFEIDAVSSLDLRVPADPYGYEGRSHSLWFGDIQQSDSFAWFETAFMVSPFLTQRARQAPFALDPGEEAAKAVWNGIAEWQVAWRFTRLDPDDLDDFVERWVGWFAAGATGSLRHPTTMPEKNPAGSWRKS